MQKILVLGFLSILVCTLIAQEKLPDPVEPAPPKHTETGTGSDGRISIDNPLSYNATGCIEKICPMEKDREYLAVKLNKAFQKETVPPAIESLFKKLEDRMREDKQTKEFLDTPIDLSAVPKDAMVRALMNMSYARNFDESLKFKDTAKGLAFDDAATMKDLESKNIPEETRKWLVRGFGYLYTPEIIDLAAHYQRLSAQDLVGKLGKTEKEAISSVVQSHEAFTKRIKEADSTFALIEKLTGGATKETLIKKIAEGKSIDEHEFIELMDMGLNSRMMLAATEKGSPFLDKLQFSLEELEKSAGSREKALEKIRRLTAQMNAKNLADYAACRSNYIMQRELLPDDAKLATITKRFNEAKGMVKEKLLKRYSEATSLRLGAVIDGFKGYLPPNRKGLDQRFEATLLKVNNEQQEGEKIWKDLGAEAKGKLASSLYALLLVMGDNLLKQADEEKCEGLSVMIASDAAINGNSITIGTMHSAVNESDSKQVMLHELGHIVSHNMRTGMASAESFGKYKTTRECLREWHPETESPRQSEKLNVADVTDYQVALTTEEDYADWASNIAQPKATSNFMCQMMPVTPDGKGWRPMGIRRAPNDNHSSHLFRLIALEKMRGQEIPEACVAALKAYGGKQNIDACL